MKIVRNIAIGVAALILLLVVGALIVVQTSPFRNYVRQKIVAAIQEGTGGVTEVGSFTFDISKLHAHLTDLVIHGSEAAGAAPFVRVAAVDLYARVFSGGRIAGISSLQIERPQVNVLVFADGRTNLPTPKPSAPSKNTPLETVVDLAVGHFELRDGMLNYNSRRQPFNVRANNLRAQLWYHELERNYQGQLSLQPVYVVAGRNAPVTVSVTLPLVLGREQIRVHDARIATPDSTIDIDASLEQPREPKFSAQVRGKIALTDLKNIADLRLENRPGLPSAIELNVNATGSGARIDVTSLNLVAGHSSLNASGELKGPRGSGPMHFQGDLALNELARLTGMQASLGGNLALQGEAALDADNRYQVSAMIGGSNLAFDQGDLHVRHADLSADVRLAPERLDLNRLRLAALGGELNADANLENFARFGVRGQLRHFDLRQILLVLDQHLPYEGTISGTLEANGDLHASGPRDFEARAALDIAPGRGGIPLQGRLHADYSGTRDDIVVDNSYLALPRTRLTLAGSLKRRLDISLISRDLHDLPVTQSAVTLNGGQAALTASVSGALSAPHIAGHLAVNQFQVENRPFDSLSADLTASDSGVAVKQGLLARDAMQASFHASAGLRHWKPLPAGRLSGDVNVQNGDLADIIALAGQSNQGFSGALTADLHVAGTIGNPSGSADVHVVNGTLADEMFDRLDLRANLSDQLAAIPAATITAGKARVELAAEFRHPRDSFATGQIHASLHTTPIDLAQLRAVEKQAPNTAGRIELIADATGNLSNSEFLVTSIRADASARGISYEGQSYGDFQLQARTAGRTATLNLTSDFAGSNIHVEGTTELVHGYPTTADAQVKALRIERVLTAVHRTDIPAKGTLALNAQVRGTLQNPEGEATVDLTNAAAYNEPIDRLHARVAYLSRRVDLTEFDVASGPSHIALSGSFDHPAGSFDTGKVQFRVTNSSLDLARLPDLQKTRPGIAGSVQLSADGSVTLTSSSPRFLVTGINADVAASNLAANGTNLGGLHLAAHTTSGQRVDFTLQSDLAGSTIQASGNGQLRGDYPVNAQVNFSNLRWTRLEPLIEQASAGSNTPPQFDATAEGKVSVNGPILHVDQMRGSMELARLAVQTLPQPGAKRSITIENQGPVMVSLDRGTLRVGSFHFTGPETDIQASGTVGVSPTQNLNLMVNAGIDLGVLKNFSRDVVSSGNVKLAAAIRGNLSNPQADGQVELHNASINDINLPNGLSNANGVILLRGKQATVQTLTAESGGGKITLSGFVLLGRSLQFNLRANASQVGVGVQEGVRITLAADLNLAGTATRSTASGTVTLQQLDYAPHSDLGSILQRAMPTVESSAAPSPLADNMKLDIRVRTSPATRVQTSLAQNLQLDADLRVRGSVSQPAILGRINLTQGQLIFFGSTYNINTGSISFFNPTRIDPILNLSLETQSKGVDVTLNVTGPVDNMKLTYTSNPPLEFQEIIALLSTGTTPTSDPTLLANQPTTPQQSLQQRGESAILGQAVANPLANRLQRVFGVTQLKIDPTFTNSSQLPTAQVTLQQQVSTNLTLTYVSALDNPNSTLIRAEWALNPQWSAMAMRDQNGIVSINLLYKKQFR
ncbi:MAG TPA: translocation/assembly module TamB domain-containing protein [Bryobacteraceae bacterium]